ncbi:phage minor head protein [Methylobacter sp.]|uniref:phage head morphogenesis protein n=1 Tax=Methylobacter sp. TaxID=2051955 RepID=UPI0024898E64|nr:phage minor head protein [Methylobacter sp.]MDI1278028.1 phage minor head protein [Methylobacter sp.]
MGLILSPTQVAFNARGDGKFNKPFQDQLDFFRKKINLPTERYDDILKSAHDRAFVVAGATKADLLNDLRGAVDKAISEGKSIEWFRKEFRSIVQKHGWEGWTGSDTAAGRDWRARVIYNTNLSASYAAGRYAQLTDPDLLQSRPYWKYVHNDTVRHPRPLHQSWSGTVLHYTHPWWQTHFCPNGYFCRCRITAVTADDYKGYPAPDDGTYIYKDRAGVNHVLPKGVDYGWDYAPGASIGKSMQPFIETKIKTLPKPLSDALAKDVAKVLTKPTPVALDGFIAAGTTKVDEIIGRVGDEATAFRSELMRMMDTEVGIKTPATVITHGSRKGAAKAVAQATQLLPNSWTKQTDAFGALYVRESVQRAFHVTVDGDYSGRRLNMKQHGFGILWGDNNAGYIATRSNDIGTALHEFTHRIQSALPELDQLFQDLHKRRTSGEPLKRLRDIYPSFNYRLDEMTREDHYINAYFGKEYDGSAKEVMTMAIESVIYRNSPLSASEHPFTDLLNNDRELFDLVIGVLFHYAP